MVDIFGNKKRDRKIAQLQANILSVLPSVTTAYKGNPYSSYASAVNELSRKYLGTAQWGNQLTQIIISIRSSFIMSGGIQISLNTDDPQGGIEQKTLKFCQDMIKLNDLDEEVPMDWATEAEIEGKALIKLIPNKEAKNIDTRHISFTQTNYKINPEPDDYKRYLSATYRVNQSDRVLTPDEFVYKRFSGRVSNINETPPRLAPVLRNIEDLDKCYWDLRKINHLFAYPTPTFTCDTASDAKSLSEFLNDEKNKWKIGKNLIMAKAKYELVGYSGADTNSLLAEIDKQAKIISGASGVPVHYLGLPDLLSNRATADTLLEVLYSTTARERHIWVGAYEEMFDKAILMANKNFQQSYIPGIISVSIPFVTSEKIKELSEVWLPLYSAGVICRDTMLEKVPGIDIEKEKGAEL